jgi:UDP:flavonoid glycosyltransferase YjiC (YdhE family)
MKPRRILLATVPFDGHFSPLTGLAVHLHQTGHDVRWYVGGHYGERVKKLGLPHYPHVSAPVINQENMDEIFPDRKRIKNPLALVRFDISQMFLTPVAGCVEDLRSIHADWPYDLIVYDLACLGAQMVQQILGIRGIAVGVLPLHEGTTNLPTDDPTQPALKRLLTRWLNHAKIFLKYDVIMKPCSELYNELRQQYGLKAEPGFMFESVFRHADLYLQSGVPGFDYPHRRLSPKIRFVGPLLPYRSVQKAAFAHLDQIQAHKRVILVTQGTVERNIEKILVPTLEAYKDDTDTLVIVTTGGAGTAELRQRFPQSHFLIDDFIDFESVMPHADVYVTNGGYGGVMLALQHKLPVVVAGVHEGKNEIAARVHFNQVGIDLRTETPKPGQIRQAVGRVLTEENYRKRVHALSEEFGLYEPIQLVEQYVNELLNESHQRIALPI